MSSLMFCSAKASSFLGCYFFLLPSSFSFLSFRLHTNQHMMMTQNTSNKQRTNTSNHYHCISTAVFVSLISIAHYSKSDKRQTYSIGVGIGYITLDQVLISCHVTMASAEDDLFARYVQNDHSLNIHNGEG